MNVYYKNHLPKAVALSVSSGGQASNPDDLYSEWLSRRISFNASNGLIMATFGMNVFIDSICFIDCNFSYASITLKNFDDVIIFQDDLYTKGRNSIFNFDKKYMVESMTLNITTGETSELFDIGYLYFGEKTVLPRFVIAPAYEIDIRSKAETTRAGQAYGLKTPTLEKFECSFEHISNNQRMEMIDYIKSVQTVIPHIIEPYTTPEFAPIYATLTDGGKFDKRDNTGFWWNTQMSWEECK
ncbi:MAG: hypothetical protein LBQ37_02445 [Elusimicrobiota bacterium]|jgi:hypothetical protein|nr:hypothetical protein [Elusimicrobiota bacterium]